MLEEIRSKVCNGFLISSTVLSIPALIASLARVGNLGWQPLFLIQISIVASLVITTLLRNRIPLFFRAWFSIGVIALVGMSGIYVLGTGAAAGALIPVSAVFCYLILGMRNAFIFSLVLALLFGIIATLHISGLRTVAPSFVAQMSNPSEWLLLALIFSMVIFSGITGIHTIDTHRLEATDRLAQKSQALNQTEHAYRDLFENAVDVIYRTDKNGVVLQMSPSSFDALGYTPEELIGTDLAQHYVDPNTKDELINKLISVKGNTTNFEAELFDKQGKVQLLSNNARFWRDSTGEVMGLQGVVRNITQQRASEIALQQSQKLDALGQLTGGIAHDFNNLLGIIMGNSELLSYSLKDEGATKKPLDGIIKATIHGAALTKRLLAFSRPDTMKPELTNIDAVVCNLEQMLQSTLGANISLVFDLQSKDACALIDANQLEASVLNLTINARDSMPNGGELIVRTSSDVLCPRAIEKQDESEQKNCIRIDVLDNGSGMTDEILKRALEPFFTSKPPGTGNGLGLSMVDHFIRQSQGSISIKSDIGVGTVVSLYLPQAAEEKVYVEDKKKAESRLPKNDTKILVVEDSPELATLFGEMLRSENYKVTIATNGKAAVELVRKDSEIGLVISDVMLPGGISGLDILEQSKTIRSDLKFILMTGFTLESQDEIHSPILHKPFTSETLLSKVADVLSEGYVDHMKS